MIPSQHTRWPPLAADIRSLRSDTRASAQPIIEFKIAVSPEASYIMPKASRPLPPEPSAHALCPLQLRVPQNAWADGSGGNGLEAFGMMYEASGDTAILNSMIGWADALVSERNDLMSAANGGQRVCWDGIIDHIWVASDLATSHPSTGCETGDAGGHLSYCALLILQTPSLWNTTVPDGDPFGYGTTYLDRAKTYVQRCDEQNDQYVLKYFIQSGTDLIRDPTNSAWTGLSTPINRQSMFFRGFAREAACHII